MQACIQDPLLPKSMKKKNKRGCSYIACATHAVSPQIFAKNATAQIKLSSCIHQKIIRSNPANQIYMHVCVCNSTRCKRYEIADSTAEQNFTTSRENKN